MQLCFIRGYKNDPLIYLNYSSLFKIQPFLQKKNRAICINENVQRKSNILHVCMHVYVCP